MHNRYENDGKHHLGLLLNTLSYDILLKDEMLVINFSSKIAVKELYNIIITNCWE